MEKLNSNQQQHICGEKSHTECQMKSHVSCGTVSRVCSGTKRRVSPEAVLKPKLKAKKLSDIAAGDQAQAILWAP